MCVFSHLWCYFLYWCTCGTIWSYALLHLWPLLRPIGIFPWQFSKWLELSCGCLASVVLVSYLIILPKVIRIPCILRHVMAFCLIADFVLVSQMDTLSRKYDQRFKAAGEVSSRLQAEEAAFRDIQVCSLTPFLFVFSEWDLCII